MPALRPTPTTPSLVRRQPIDLGGVAQDAGAGIGAGAGAGIAGAGDVVGTAVSGGGEAMSQVANAPNAAISAGADAAGDQIANQVSKQASAYFAEAWANLKANLLDALTPFLIFIAIATVVGLGVWRWKFMKNRKRTFWLGRPIGEAGGVGGGKTDGYNEKD